MGKRSKVVLIVSAVVLVGAVVALSAANRRQPSVEVRLEKVSKRGLTSIVTASGKIEPQRKVDVSSDITGRIVNLAVREGDMVTRGQTLVHIDPQQYEAGVQRAEAMLAGALAGAAQAQANKDQAQRAWTRARDIHAQNAQLVSQETLEQAETAQRIAVANLDASQRQVDQARAGLREAQDQLRKTTILAPMSGRVTRLAVEEGEVAVPGTFSRETGLLMTISDLSVIQVKVKVDETDVVRIHRGDSTEVSIDAFPDTSYSGHVTEIKNSSVAGASTSGLNTDQAVDYEVIVTLDHPPAGIRPDLSATARIVTDRRAGVLTVPIIALTVRPASDTLPLDSTRGAASAKRPAGTAGNRAGADSAAAKKDVEGIFIVDTLTMSARFHPVRIGIAGDEYFEVLTGVREGQTIVAGPYQAIRDLHNDAKVRNQSNTAGRGGAARRGS